MWQWVVATRLPYAKGTQGCAAAWGTFEHVVWWSQPPMLLLALVLCRAERSQCMHSLTSLVLVVPQALQPEAASALAGVWLHAFTWCGLNTASQACPQTTAQPLVMLGASWCFGRSRCGSSHPIVARARVLENCWHRLDPIRASSMCACTSCRLPPSPCMCCRCVRGV